MEVRYQTIGQDRTRMRCQAAQAGRCSDETTGMEATEGHRSRELGGWQSGPHVFCRMRGEILEVIEQIVGDDH